MLINKNNIDEKYKEIKKVLKDYRFYGYEAIYEIFHQPKPIKYLPPLTDESYQEILKAILDIMSDDINKDEDNISVETILNFKKQILSLNKSKPYIISTINSNFKIMIDSTGLKVYNPIKNFENINNFEIQIDNFNNCYCLVKSPVIMQVVRGNEFELPKRIFVKISDCPMRLQKYLYKARKNQLLKEHKNKDEEEYAEIKKQKRLEFRNKIFPFLKK